MHDGQRFAEQDNLAKYLGFELLESSPGRAKVKAEIRAEYLNSFKIVHGGAIFALADFAFAVAANSHGTVAMAVSVTMFYLKAVTAGTLFAEAEEVSLNPKLGTYTARVTDAEGNLVATFQGMAYRKKDPLPV